MPGAGGPNAAVEVEMRLGLIYTMDLNGGFQSRAFKSRPGSAPVVITPAYRSANNTRFMSGVCERDFRGYFAGAEKLAPLQAGQHHHRAVTTAYNYGNGRRMNQDSAGTLSMESKEKVLVGASRTHTLDIALPACPYDIRIGITVEIPQPVSELAAGWEQKRRKDRTTFVPTDSSWQLDFTSVTTERQGGVGMGEDEGDDGVTYEVEMELRQEGCMRWLQQGGQEGPLAINLAKSLTLLMPPDVESTELTPIQDGVKIRAALDVLKHAERDTMPEFSGGGSNSRPNFPGASPVGMRRFHIRSVLQNRCPSNGSPADYYVAEKTDGVRYLLVIAMIDTPEGGFNSTPFKTHLKPI